MSARPEPVGPRSGALHRPFRARAARVVGTVLAVAVLAMVAAIALLLPPPLPGQTSGLVGPSVNDRIGIVLFGVLVAWFLMRHAGVRADPDDDGLTVRNLLLTRRVAWAQIVSVRFGRDRPWVQLDLDDGTTLAVMAVQSADGSRARDEARRLATLVALHSRTARDD